MVPTLRKFCASLPICTRCRDEDTALLQRRSSSTSVVEFTDAVVPVADADRPGAPEPRYSNATAPLHAGDVLLLYTDGLVEARNRDGAEFGENSLAAHVRRNCELEIDDLVASLRDEALRFAGRLHDDMTQMAFRFE